MDGWTPRSGYEQVGGYVWLPRLLDKTRRAVAGEAGDYYALDASPLDQSALKLWRVTGDQIREWVVAGLSDEAIASRIAQAGGARPEAASRTFSLLWGPSLLVLDADEGRAKGPLAAVLRGVVPALLGARKLLVALGVTKPE